MSADIQKTEQNPHSDIPVGKKPKTFSVIDFFMTLFKSSGIMLFGMMVGAGIILKNPPIAKDSKTSDSLIQHNKTLKSEIESLKKELQDNKIKLLDKNKSSDYLIKESWIIR